VLSLGLANALGQLTRKRIFMNRVLTIVLLGVVASFSLASLACSHSPGDTYSGTWKEINDRRQFTISSKKSDMGGVDRPLYDVSGCAGSSFANLNSQGDLLIAERDSHGTPRYVLMVYEKSTGHLKGRLCGGDGEWKKQ
jgi:hypothetical protein